MVSNKEYSSYTRMDWGERPIKIEFSKIIMPYVNIQITQGATREQKAQLVREVTDSLVRILDKKPEHTHIVIQEIAEENWGFAGMLTDDWKKQQ
jgi:4-oxalocrotonate tautomerase